MRLERDADVADVDSRRQQEGLHKERVEARLPPVRAGLSQFAQVSVSLRRSQSVA
jgi:hypothetical protein